MNGWVSKGVLTVFVVASLAAGRAITEAMPNEAESQRGAAAPFIVEGTIGKEADLRYANVTLERIRPALGVAALNGRSTTPGHFLVADIVMEAKDQPRALAGMSILASDGRVFHADQRWPIGQAPTGVPWHVTVVFEMPQDAFEGAILEVAQANDWFGQRRDHVLHVDLDIDEAEAAELAASKDIVHGPKNGLEPPDTEVMGQVSDVE